MPAHAVVLTLSARRRRCSSTRIPPGVVLKTSAISRDVSPCALRAAIRSRRAAAAARTQARQVPACLRPRPIGPPHTLQAGLGRIVGLLSVRGRRRSCGPSADRQELAARGRPARASLRGLRGGRRCAPGRTTRVGLHSALEVKTEPGLRPVAEAPGSELGAARVDIARRDAERTRQGCGVNQAGLRGRHRLISQPLDHALCDGRGQSVDLFGAHCAHDSQESPPVGRLRVLRPVTPLRARGSRWSPYARVVMNTPGVTA